MLLLLAYNAVLMLGALWWAGEELNVLTAIAASSSIGLGVDASAHVCAAYLLHGDDGAASSASASIPLSASASEPPRALRRPPPATSAARTRRAVARAGPAVMHGGLSTLAAVAPLVVAASSYVLRVLGALVGAAVVWLLAR